MKRPLLAISSFLVVFFGIIFLTPTNAIAANCGTMGGVCQINFGACSQGMAIPNTYCLPGFQCCPQSYMPAIKCTSNGQEGVNTALGCVVVNTGNDLITTVLRLATGLGGGLALALILYGVFIVTTSAGMPDKLKAGGEIITSAVIGLIFILLSIFLVNLIGINILGIPGLS